MIRAGRLAVALLLAIATSAAAGDALSPEQLKRDLEQGARLFRQRPDAKSANAVAKRLSWVDVRWNESTLTVRDPWLDDAVAALDRLTPEQRKRQLETIAEHLSARATQVDTLVAMAEPAASPGTTPAPPPEEILEGILEESRFQTPPEDPKLAQAAARFRDTLRSAWKSVRDFVTDLFRPRNEGGAWERIRQLLVMGFATLAVLVLAWFVVRLLFRAAVDSASEEPETEMPEEPPRPAEMAAEAKSRTESGDHRGAIRALYLALLGRLHQQGAIVYDRHRTNREYLRSMRAAPERKAAFAELVDVFDRTWYGKEPCSRADVEAFEAATLRAGDASLDRRVA